MTNDYLATKVIKMPLQKH